MKSVRLLDAGLTMVETSVPKPGPGEVLVRVAAAGITPTELLWYPTTHQKDGQKRMEAVPAHEFSGRVAAIGEGIADLSVGQEIYGMNDWFEDGALAEYCLTRPEWVAPKPKTLSHAESATVPIGALTAWQGLFDRAKLQVGERVLIHGGAGAVGVFAVQLARSRGAHVITTVSSANIEFARELGADEVIDYRSERFEERAKNIDVLFDAVGGETLARSWGLLNSVGRAVTITADGASTNDPREKEAFFIVEPKRGLLIEIGRLLDAGELRAFADTVLPLECATDAYSGKLKKRGRGKVVIDVGSSAAARV
jgi:NADPH:quinone reductase-like Zn-dependent oxidoreductase